jgi:hypothetical protein
MNLNGERVLRVWVGVSFGHFFFLFSLHLDTKAAVVGVANSDSNSINNSERFFIDNMWF